MTGDQVHGEVLALINQYRDAVAQGRDGVAELAHAVMHHPLRHVVVMLAVAVSWIAPPVADTSTTPPSAEALTQLVDQYSAALYEGGGARYGPWPDDPDGGELRVIAALRDTLTMLDDATRINPSPHASVSMVELRRVIGARLTEHM